MNVQSKATNVTEPEVWIVRYQGRFRPFDLLTAAQATPEIAVQSANVTWIRFRADERTARGIISRLAGAAFRLTESGGLVRLGERVPTMTLPELDWLPAESQFERHFPVAKFPESVDRDLLSVTGPRIPLRLVPATQSAFRSPLPAEAILAGVKDLWDWVDLARASRLSRLRWGLVNDLALVIGRPLPPIPGRHFSKMGRILVPSGKGWSPDLPTKYAEALLDGSDVSSVERLYLWQPDGTIIRIPGDEIQTLRRAAVRTLAAVD